MRNIRNYVLVTVVHLYARIIFGSVPISKPVLIFLGNIFERDVALAGVQARV